MKTETAVLIEINVINFFKHCSSWFYSLHVNPGLKNRKFFARIIMHGYYRGKVFFRSFKISIVVNDLQNFLNQYYRREYLLSYDLYTITATCLFYEWSLKSLSGKICGVNFPFIHKIVKISEITSSSWIKLLQIWCQTLDISWNGI